MSKSLSDIFLLLSLGLFKSPLGGAGGPSYVPTYHIYGF